MRYKVDLKDKKILYELDKDSRQSNKQIAKKVGLSEQVVGNRIRRLLDMRVIEYFFVKTNPSIMGYLHVKVYLRFHNLTKEKEDELLKELNKERDIYWLASLRGKYDLVCSLYIKNIADFSRIYQERYGKWSDYIWDRNVIVLEKAFTYTKAYLLPNQKAEEIIYSSKGERQIKLNNLDISLLKILNKNGRKPLIDMANQLNVSPDTIKYRIKGLKEKKVITGFGVKIDFSKLDNDYNIIFLKLQNMTFKKEKEFENFARSNKNLIIFIKTIGDHDIELEVETSNKSELDHIIKLLRDYFSNEIKEYEILEVTREHRMTYFPF